MMVEREKYLDEDSILRSAFNHFDKNKDGYISPEEFMYVFLYGGCILQKQCTQVKGSLFSNIFDYRATVLLL